MEEEKAAVQKENEKDRCRPPHMKKTGGPGVIYGLGFLGALVYFLVHATGFWSGVLGILEAIVWPALIVYKVLGILHF